MSETTIYRALVVDDEPLVREATSRAMRKFSFWCDTACDGEQALQMCRKTVYDLVVTDLKMPKRHGHSLIMELFNIKATPHIVVLTGVADPRLVKDLITIGVNDIINKPVDYSLLAAKLQSLLQRNTSVGSVRSSGNSGQVVGGKQAVAKIEHELELFSDCVPASLDELFALAEQTVNPPAENVSIFIERLAAKRVSPSEQRQAQRISLFTTAVAIPVDKDFCVQGEGFKMTMLDISESGACLVDTRMVYHKYLALRWSSSLSPGVFLKAVMEVKRAKPMGPFYGIAGEFVVHD